MKDIKESKEITIKEDKKETVYFTAKRIADSIEPKAKDVLYVTEEIMKAMDF